MKISIVIPTLNRSKNLKELLLSINSALKYEPDLKNKISLEIIVVDQSENKKTENVCKEFNVKFLKSEKKGLSRSRNIGLDRAIFEFLIFFDDDVILKENYFKKLLLMFERHKNLDSFTGKILTLEKNKSYSRHQNNFPKWLDIHSFDQVLSSGTGFSSSYIDDIGKFDERFGLGSLYGGSEEGDIILRGINNKKRIFYNPDLISYHPEEKGEFKFSLSRFKRGFSYGKGRGALMKKHKESLKLMITTKNFLNPILGFLYNLLKLNLNLSSENLGSFFGRINGYFLFKK